MDTMNNEEREASRKRFAEYQHKLTLFTMILAVLHDRENGVEPDAVVVVEYLDKELAPYRTAQ